MKTTSLTSENAVIPGSRLSAAKGLSALYDSQAACMVFACGTVFKVSSLPGLVHAEMLSDTFWLYLFMIALDILCLACVFRYASSGADAALRAENTLPYRALCLLTSLYLAVKGAIYFVYTVVFLMVDLFVGIPPYVVVLILAAPVIYLGVKGLRGIARCAELLVPVMLVIVVANFAFLETDLDFGRNLPVNALPPGEFFARGLRFGMWLGDMFPLLFADIKRKKFPFLAVGTGVSYALVAVTCLVAVAMYGNALPYVYNILIRLSGFNKFSLEIGRLDWAAIFIVIVMAMLSLSLHMWGAAEGAKRVTGTPLPALVAFSAVIVILPLALPNTHEAIDFSVTEFGYVMCALALFIALSFFALTFRKRWARSAPYLRERGVAVGEGRNG